MICLRRDAKFRSGLVIYREKPKLYKPLGQVLCSHSCKIRPRHDPFRPSLDVPWWYMVLGKNECAETANNNAKG